MKASITRIGNSKGVIIPAQVLQQCGFEDEVSLEIQADSLVITKAKKPRAGWEHAFRKAGTDEISEDDFNNDFDQDEWTW